MQYLPAFGKWKVLHLMQNYLTVQGLWSDPTTSLGVAWFGFFVLAGNRDMEPEHRQSIKRKFPVLHTDGFNSPPLIHV